MLDKIKTYLSLAFVFLLGVFLWERKAKEDAQAELLLSKLNQKNALDRQDIDNSQSVIKSEVAKIAEAKAELDQANSVQVTPEQELDFWSKR